jgi:hypothetical protein
MTAALLFSICSCASGTTAENEIYKIQEELSSAGSFRFLADIRADYGERVYDYKVSFEGLDNDGLITIIEPESVSGAAVRLSDEGTHLVYDNAEIYTGEILPDGLSPVDAVPTLINAWRSGLVTECVREKQGDTESVAALFRISDEVNLRTWFDGDSHLPIYAEIYFNGYTVLSVTLYNVETE